MVTWLLKVAVLADNRSHRSLQEFCFFFTPSGTQLKRLCHTLETPWIISSYLLPLLGYFVSSLSINSQELADAARRHSVPCTPIGGGCSRTPHRLPEQSGKQVSEVRGGDTATGNECIKTLAKKKKKCSSIFPRWLFSRAAELANQIWQLKHWWTSFYLPHRCSPAQTGTTREAPEDHRLAWASVLHGNTHFLSVCLLCLFICASKYVSSK